MDEETTTHKIIERIGLPQKICHPVLAAETFVPASERASFALKDGEALVIWPPLAGR